MGYYPLAHTGLAKALEPSVSDYSIELIFGLAIAWCSRSCLVLPERMAAPSVGSMTHAHRKTIHLTPSPSSNHSPYTERKQRTLDQAEQFAAERQKLASSSYILL
jgi:hypothetical protein